MSNKPKTKREWALCRCKLSCKVGRDKLNDAAESLSEQTAAQSHALFSLLHAVEELANVLELDSQQPTSANNKTTKTRKPS